MTPEFCSVYVIAKGKISYMRCSTIAPPPPPPSSSNLQLQDHASNVSEASNSQFMRTQLPNIKAAERMHYQSGNQHFDEIRLPSRRGRHSMDRSYDLSPDIDISIVSSERPSMDRMYPSFLDSMDSRRNSRHLSSSESEYGSSMSSHSRSTHFKEINFPKPEYSSSSSVDRGDSWLSQNSNNTLDDVELEMRRLRLQLKQTMEMYNTTCKEARTEKHKENELNRCKIEEGQRLEEARLAEEFALVEREITKCHAAIQAAASAKRLAELEAQKKWNPADNKARKESEEMKKPSEEREYDVRYRRYAIEDIEVATCNFSRARKIGEGGYGPVYKGELDHTQVALKVLRPDAAQGRSQFQQEVEVLSCIRHPNMVLLLGACPEFGCLVYEYMGNGSLEDRLFCRGNTPVIPWQLRFRIAAEIATGLLFLHQAKPEPLVHRDLKPSNILLDNNYVSKISDVGLARLVPPSVADVVTQYHMTSTAGTFCYIDPEYQQTGMLGTKSDIYSLGVLLLQIITAKPPMGLTHQVERAIETGRIFEMLDPAVHDWPVEEALKFAKLSLQCAEMRKKDRPDLRKVVLPELNRLRAFAEDSLQCVIFGGGGVLPPNQNSNSTSQDFHAFVKLCWGSSATYGCPLTTLQQLENEKLIALPSHEEVLSAVKGMDLASAPGPDGFNRRGFKQRIDNLVITGQVHTISSPQGVRVPSHVLFADDVIVFCRGDQCSLNAIMQFFEEYGLNSGQIINRAKSSVFISKHIQRRQHSIVSSLGMKLGSTPFTYLDVPIFRGKPRSSYFQPITEKIRVRFSSWKGSMLSMASRLQLIKSTIYSMLIHSFQVYQWSISLLRRLEVWCRNFLWSGSIDSRGVPLIAWKQCCSPLDEGGVGLKQLRVLISSLHLKKAWDVFTSVSDRSTLLRTRFWRNGKLRRSYATSSIWPGVKHLWPHILENGKWLIGLVYSRSSQLRELWLAAFVVTLWCIWKFRNQARFDGVQPNVSKACILIFGQVIASNKISSGCMNNRVFDLSILKKVGVPCKPSKAPCIVEVNWHPPLFGWVKVNTDGAWCSSSGQAGYGGIFQDFRGGVLGAFCFNFNMASSVAAEVMAVIKAIELAWVRDWKHVWLEVDSSLVITFLRSPHLVPWQLRVEWGNSLDWISQMHFRSSHIFREGEQGDDKSLLVGCGLGLEISDPGLGLALSSGLCLGLDLVALSVGSLGAILLPLGLVEYSSGFDSVNLDNHMCMIDWIIRLLDMGIYLSAPKTDKVSEDGENDRLRFGASSMQGWRSTMEDAHAALLDLDNSTSFFGVYDGHGGKAVANFCAKYLHLQVLNQEAYLTGDLGTSLQKAFLRMDEMMRGQRGWRELAVLGDKIDKVSGLIEGFIFTPKSAEAKRSVFNDQMDLWSSEEGPHSDFDGPTSGSTACVAIIRNNQLVVANAGDSRCVISRKGQAYPLSKDHKPDIENEKERILKAGGFIQVGRVNGSLNLARAIGDVEFKQNKQLPVEKQIVTANPDVQSVEICDDDEFLVIACDGIWYFKNPVNSTACIGNNPMSSDPSPEKASTGNQPLLSDPSL
ncbi:hypothetical protein ACLB2K_059426 [Fragaria x ananassa]